MAFLQRLILGPFGLLNKWGRPGAFRRGLQLHPEAKMTSLEGRLLASAQAYHKDLEDRFVEDGFFIQDIPNDLGDQTVWQGVYTAYRAMRYARTGAKTDLEEALYAAGVLAMAGSGHMVRGVAHHGFAGDRYVIDGNHSRHYRKRFGHMTREDASFDSLCGWLFGMSFALKYLPPVKTGHLRSAARQYAEDFKRADYFLVNSDGSRTVYGDIQPKTFQAPMRTLAAITVLRLGGDCEWAKLAKKHAYALTQTAAYVPKKWKSVNDHLAMLSGFAFLAMGDAQGDVTKGLQRLVDRHIGVGNSFLAYMARLFGLSVHDDQIGNADQIMAEFAPGLAAPNGKDPVHPPVDLRGDESIPQKNGRALEPLPPWRGPVYDYLWQRDQNSLTGSHDRPCSGLDFLMAYEARISGHAGAS